MTSFIRDRLLKETKNVKSLSSESYTKLGCDVPIILEAMMSDQREHMYARFGETYLKYRVLVFQWMMEVCEYFNLDPTTTHGAMAYLDRLQPNEKFSRFEWQMLAICCILIAGKYNESEEDLPDLATLEDITQQRIPNETVLSYELWALKRMGWKLSVRTPMAFLSCYMSLGVTSDDDFERKCSSSTREEISSVLEKQLHALVTTITLDHKFKKYPGSVLAAAVLYSARKKLNFSSVWPQHLIKMTGCEAKSLVELVGYIEDAYAASSKANSNSIQAQSLSPSITTADDDNNKENKLEVVEGEVRLSVAKDKFVARASPTSISNVDDYQGGGHHKKTSQDEEDHMMRILASTTVSAE